MLPLRSAQCKSANDPKRTFTPELYLTFELPVDRCMEITCYVASSLGSFIANADGDVPWLDELDTPQEPNGFKEFFFTIDALIME